MRGGSRSKRDLKGDRHCGGDGRRVAPRVSFRDSVRVVLPVRGLGRRHQKPKQTGIAFSIFLVNGNYTGVDICRYLEPIQVY